MKRLIITDSCAELNEEIRKKSDIRKAPFFIDVEDKHYIADDNLNIDDLLTNIKDSKEVSRTAAPTPESFMRNIEGYDEIYMVSISKKLSGAYNSANIAKTMIEEENPEIKVHVFDSKSAACGETQVISKIQSLFEENESFENIIKKTEKFIESMNTIFVLEDLDTLIKNGRMSKVAGFVASALNIYPICVNNDGEIKVKHKSRGLKKAMSKMIETIGELAENTSDRILYITHIRNEERANQLKELVQKRYKFKEIEIFEGTGLSAVYANKNGIIMAF